eukprot:15366687-Alexandrium_andersonii.AAC.1
MCIRDRRSAAATRGGRAPRTGGPARRRCGGDRQSTRPVPFCPAEVAGPAPCPFARRKSPAQRA